MNKSMIVPDDALHRMIQEQTKTRKLLDKLERIIWSDKEFDGLTLEGGLKTILRKYHEEKEKVRKLEKELEKLIRSK